MPRNPEVPEKAIQAFEKLHHLQVTIHDFRGSLSSVIRSDRYMHQHPLCRCVKAAGGEWNCVNFEVMKVRAGLHAYPEGRYHVCHAGLVEWITPVYDGLELAWVIFAGARSPGPNFNGVHREPLTRWKTVPWDERTPFPAPVDCGEADLILEHLVQLAARLHAWAQQEERPLSVQRPPLEAMVSSPVLRRRMLIRRYIESKQAGPLRLRDLAAELKVSEDRATHLVRECCGQSFREMLIEARLKTAMELLRVSSLPILQVALCSGFAEISYFNRLFRRRLGCTPGQYRRADDLSRWALPLEERMENPVGKKEAALSS